MGILYKRRDNTTIHNILGFEYIYETENYFIDISMRLKNEDDERSEPTNTIKYLYIEHKTKNYELSYDCERFMTICECYDVVYVGELSFRVGGKLDF
tara:strand:+ start:862 stop:1152 length:291 start_codon:yes stop_codon:yes gene_type:complete